MQQLRTRWVEDRYEICPPAAHTGRRGNQPCGPTLRVPGQGHSLGVRSTGVRSTGVQITGPVGMARRIMALKYQEQASETQAAPAAQAVELRKTYGAGQAVVHALAGVSVTFERGRFTAVMGPSGSGKSTLMHCMAGLDRPTSGQTFVGEEDIGSLDDAGLTQLRRDRIGFVFQSFNLVPTLTAAENITLPAALAGAKVDQAWFDYLVAQLGLGDRLAHRPNEMSGGQQQRVACARALINKP